MNKIMIGFRVKSLLLTIVIFIVSMYIVKTGDHFDQRKYSDTVTVMFICIWLMFSYYAMLLLSSFQRIYRKTILFLIFSFLLFLLAAFIVSIAFELILSAFHSRLGEVAMGRGWGAAVGSMLLGSPGWILLWIWMRYGTDHSRSAPVSDSFH